MDARTLAQLLLAELELCRPSRAIGSARPSSRARLPSTIARLEHQIATCQAPEDATTVEEVVSILRTAPRAATSA